jgi:hypothetical protein
MLYATNRELPPIYGLKWKPHRRVHFRYDNTHPFSGSHHQKIVVIDDRVAFVGGLDITGRRWDTPEHRPEDPRRTAGDKPYPPFHDAMIAVDGDAAKTLATLARKRWAQATGNHIEPVETESDPWPGSLAPAVLEVDIGIACTAPKTDVEPGRGRWSRLYLDMIARAWRYIYMENQYFTSDKIGDGLPSASSSRIGQMILVSRLLSHGWLEEVTMTTLRNRLLLKPATPMLIDASTPTTRTSRASPRAPASTFIPRSWSWTTSGSGSVRRTCAIGRWEWTPNAMSWSRLAVTNASPGPSAAS